MKIRKRLDNFQCQPTRQGSSQPLAAYLDSPEPASGSAISSHLSRSTLTNRSKRRLPQVTTSQTTQKA